MDENIQSSAELQNSTVSLTELHKALNERGVEISYGELSALINIGDIAEQLQVGGKGNRREFPAAAIEVLAAFYPNFKAKGFKRPQAPEALRAFLSPGSAVPGNNEIMRVSPVLQNIQPATDPVEVAIAGGRAQGLAAKERVLTAQEAADELHISLAQFKAAVKAGTLPQPWKRFGKTSRGDRWRYSDLME